MKQIKPIIHTGLKRYLTVFLYLCGCTIFAPSCLVEAESTEIPKEGVDTEVTISISVPNPVLPTKSLTAADEEKINSIALLVFDTSGNYLYTSHADDITVNSNSEIRDFTAVLKTGTADIMLLANCRDLLNEYYPNGIDEGTSKEVIAEKLVVSAGTRWITDTSASDYRDIPMWGEIGQVTITSSTTTLGSTPYDIHRMVARIDVTTSLSSSTDFKLTSVRLYHYNDKGRVIPVSSGFNSDIPTIPDEATVQKGPLVYDGTAITSDANGNPACIREIYLFEAAAGKRLTHPEHICLVIGGEYKGIPGFHRVDFQRTTLNNGREYLDILRNHHYQVIITGVEDAGFTDPDEAYEAYPVNMDAQVIDWSEDNSDDITISGNYILKLSTDELVFNPSGGIRYMYIYTNHPQGWKFVEDNFIPSVNWISFDPVAGAQGAFTEVKVTVQENTDTNLRFYEFPVVVGQVEKTLTFAQRGTGDVELEVYVTPNPALLGKFMTTPLELKVSTYPANMPLYFDYQGDITWEPGYGIPAGGSTLSTIQLLPSINNSASLRTGYLTVYIQDAAGHIASCIVELHQTTKITGLSATLSNPYPATPGTYTFQLASTVPWQVDYVSDGATWIPSFGMGLQPPGSLANYNFDLTGNPAYENRRLDVSFLAPESGEYETLQFEQSHIAPQLNTPDGQTVVVPSENGQTVNIRFESNADWSFSYNNTYMTSLGSQVNSSTISGTGVGYDLKVTEIEIKTGEFPLSTSTRAAGTKVSLPACYVNISNFAPYTLTEAQYRKTFTLERIVPPIAELNTSLTTTSTSVYGISSNNPAGSSAEYIARTNSGAHNLSIRCWANADFEAWTSLDATRVRYTYNGTIMTSNASVSLPIPANPGSSDRVFTLYIQAVGSNEIKTYQFEQHGHQNLSVTILSPTGTIPTGGDRCNNTD